MMFLISMGVHAQDILAMQITLDVDNIPLIQVLEQLEQSEKITFAYSPNRIPLEKRVTISRKDTRLDEVLIEIFKDTEVLFQSKNSQIILYRETKLEYTISGYIRDKQTRELLFGANIYEVGAYRGVYSNKSGFYSLTLAKGKYKIMSTYIGYQSSIDSIDLSSDLEMDIYLETGGELIEILVTADPIQKNQEFIVKRKNDASHKIDVEKVNNLPSFFGEEDVMLYMQLVPGTSSNGVLGSNINIRGSESDQNLILLDGIPIYNTRHLFGLVSVFEQNAVKSVEAHTRAFSAVYSGKLSSIMDIRLKEGDKNKYHAQVSVGLLSTKGFVEGPIRKEKSSFILSYRRSVFDVLARSNDVTLDPVPTYYDVTTKINFDLSKKDKLSFIYYQGNDVLGGADTILSKPIGLDDDSNFIYKNLIVAGSTAWGNNVIGSKWYHKLNKKAYLTSTLHYTKFQYKIGLSQSVIGQSSGYELAHNASVEQLGVKTRLDYRLNTKHYLNLGIGGVWYKTDPGKSSWIFNIDEQYELSRDAKDVNSKEFYLFLEDEYQINENWTLQYGMYNSLLRTDDTTYFYPQPRLKIRYEIDVNQKLEASYSKMVQYDRILENTNFDLGANMWFPSTKKVEPQLAHHISLDYSYRFDTIWNFTSGVFYKKMNNIVRPLSGVNVLNSLENWEDRLVLGSGKAYGLEIMLEKMQGKTRGWISYYLGKSTRQFDSFNNGKVFPYKYSKKHNINIVLLHRFKSKKRSRRVIGLIWQYASGYYSTIPTRWHYDLFGNKVLDYDEENNYKFPATHSLNMSYTWSRTTRRGVTWTIKTGIYNLYRNYNVFNDNLILTDEMDYKLSVSSFTHNPVPYLTFNFGLN